MLLYFMVIIGVFMFGFGVYSLMKNNKNRKFIKLYENCAYWGIGMSALGVILSMESVFIKLPGILPTSLPVIILMFIMSVVNFFLKSLLAKI